MSPESSYFFYLTRVILLYMINFYVISLFSKLLDTSQTSSNNFKTINASIDYILSSKTFDEPLF